MEMEGLSSKIFQTMLKKLQHEGTLERILQIFKISTKNNSQKIRFIEKLLKENNLLPNYDEFRLVKCNKKAEEFKNSGNQLYRDKKYPQALVSYNKSLCYSPENSDNVGIAFANRSAVYLAMGQYEKCLENIELAKNHNYPKDKIDKLNKREEEALEKLSSSPDPNQEFIKYEAARERYLKPKLRAKKNFDFFVADCLELKISPEFGRHLITNEDLKVGSVIAVEKPFSKIVGPGATYEACDNCLRKNVLSLIPCLNCCSAMFCSEDCRNDAQEKFHKYECGLVDAIDKLLLRSFTLTLRTYLEALDVCGTPSKLREFLDSIKDSNKTFMDFEYTDEASSRKNLLHAVSTLVTFEKSQYNDDFDDFNSSNHCAIMCDLMLNHSLPLKALLVDDVDQDVFREFIFKFGQIAAINSHSLQCTSSASSLLQFGTGIYPFCSLMNHSCAPNVVRRPIRTSNYIVVQRPIKKGEQIFDSYGLNHFLEPIEERQKGLIRHHRFQCKCEACLYDYPMDKCLKIKNKSLNEALIKERSLLMKMQELEFADQYYEKYCQLIDEFDEKDYPSHEIRVWQTTIKYCLGFFSRTECFDM